MGLTSFEDTMTGKNGRRVGRHEVAYFEQFWKGESYNPVGWRLRLKRELGSLRRVSGTDALGRVLSVGCGDGQFEILLAPFATSVTAIDISQEAIAAGHRNVARAGVTNIDFECIPVSELRQNEQFDTIASLGFLHHLPEADLPGFLRQMYMHLKPGGIFYAQEPNARGVLRKIGRVLLGRRYHELHSPDELELDPRETRQLLLTAGFSQVEIGYIDFTLFPALCILAKGPSWPMYVCSGIDWIWCRSPLANWASGFTASACKGRPVTQESIRK